VPKTTGVFGGFIAVSECNQTEAIFGWPCVDLVRRRNMGALDVHKI